LSSNGRTPRGRISRLIKAADTLEFRPATFTRRRERDKNAKNVDAGDETY
jgi:hypothetical protein